MKLYVERFAIPDFEPLIRRCERLSDVMILDSSAEGRYSYICFEPFAQLRVKNRQVHWNQKVIQTSDIWSYLQAQLNHYQQPHHPHLPPFQGGAVGYFGYELSHTLISYPWVADPMALPDGALNFYDAVAAYDHLKQELVIMASGVSESGIARVSRAKQALRRYRQVLVEPFELRDDPMPSLKSPSISSNFSKQTYMQAVLAMQNFIRRGDMFQANLTQQFTTTVDINVSKIQWYLALRRHNPAPFGAYLQLKEDEWLLSSSPERFIRLASGKLQAEPIKGTRRRCQDDLSQDELIRQELMSSPKDRSENVMIVDLMRNDLSRVSRAGSVAVRELCALKTFATVHHLVSTIVAELEPEHDAVAVLKATFPPGSVTGAPKIKAMEHISHLEQTARGPYCGCLGYLGFDGDMDMAVTIRTYAVKKNQVFFSAGGAVVLDSHPEAEYLESLTKAERLKDILGKVQ